MRSCADRWRLNLNSRGTSTYNVVYKYRRCSVLVQVHVMLCTLYCVQKYVEQVQFFTSALCTMQFSDLSFNDKTGGFFKYVYIFDIYF